MISLLKRLYTRLWRASGANMPWTYLIRRWLKRHARWAVLTVASLIVGGIAGQVLGVTQFGLKAIPIVLFVDFLFYLGGHILWDTSGDYIPNPERFRRD